MDDDGYDVLFKIILVGDTSVGKTNIISIYKKFISGGFLSYNRCWI